MNDRKQIARWVRMVLFILLPFAFCLSSTGCTILGLVASTLPPPDVQPQYIGLAGQKVGIMVWADQGLRIDWANLRLDLANAVRKKLIAEKKTNSVKDATFDVQPASIVRYQMDHPEIEALPPNEIAPRLGVTRLIYVEMEDFVTRSDMAVDLYRGQAKATVRVVEVTNGVGKVVFDRANVVATYPPKAPREGVPNAGDVKIYNGLIDTFSTEIVHLFVPWTPENW
jgi:hypothetical protein